MFPLLEVEDLRIKFDSTEVVKGISFYVGSKETVGIVGESGSGKSITAMAIQRLLERAKITGSVRFGGRELLDLPEKVMCRYRGSCIAAIFQDPMTSLNPLMPIGKQISEGTNKTDKEVAELLDLVGISDPEVRMHQYPHELSGGMRQRVMIAIALACNPQLLIADEPTTSLDVTTQAQILDLLKSLQKKLGMGLLLITHDYGVIAGLCDRVIVMREGKIVDEGTPDFLYHQSENSYTRLLVHEVATTTEEREIHTEPLVTLENLKKNYKTLRAIDDVSFTIHRNETVCLVGESGCGKSTLAKLLVNLEKPSSGCVHYHISPKKAQIVFQNPYSSLDPHMTIEQILAEGFKIHRMKYNDDTLEDLIHSVGLSIDFLDRHPYALSGGQRQRVGIARALAVQPELLILDEPLSALDLTAQHQILELLSKLKYQRQLTYLFITHDLSVVKEMADRVAVMYQGQIMESAPVKEFFDNPQHPYTQALLSAIPHRDPRLEKARQPILLQEDTSSSFSPKQGCSFKTRCPKAFKLCNSQSPELIAIGNYHSVACHLQNNV